MTRSKGKSLPDPESSSTENAKPAGKKSPPSASYLVRFWLEPQDGEEPSLRGYVRHLGTGEESYVGDPGELGEHILKQLPDTPNGSDGSAHKSEPVKAVPAPTHGLNPSPASPGSPKAVGDREKS